MNRNSYVEINVNKLCENVNNIVKTFSGYKYYIGVIKGNAYPDRGYELEMLMVMENIYLSIL